MKKPLYIYIAVMTIAVVSYFLWIKETKIINEASVDSTVARDVVASNSVTNEPQLMTSREIASIKPLGTISKAEIRAIHDSLPNEQQVKEDFNNNPHMPPKSLMAFAKKLGPAMEKAYKNEADANALVQELNVCAKDDSVSNAARALCVQDTEKLSSYHPHLQDQAKELRAGMSPEVKKILETNEAAIK